MTVSELPYTAVDRNIILQRRIAHAITCRDFYPNIFSYIRNCRHDYRTSNQNKCYLLPMIAHVIQTLKHWTTPCAIQCFSVWMMGESKVNGAKPPNYAIMPPKHLF